jgi:hypothetical protein
MDFATMDFATLSHPAAAASDATRDFGVLDKVSDLSVGQLLFSEKVVDPPQVADGGRPNRNQEAELRKQPGWVGSPSSAVSFLEPQGGQ